MSKVQLLLGVVCLALSADLAHAHGWSFGFSVGGPPVGPRPWCPPPWGGYYYRPYPVVYAPPPVVLRPAPIIVEQPAVVVPVPAAVTTAVPAVTNATPPPPTLQSVRPAVAQAQQVGSAARVNEGLQQLGDPRESVRRNAAIDLGRLRAEQAIEPLIGLLSGDGSPVVRDAAARALGLIGSPRGLNALIHAAQADQDRDVRHSAQFAVEIIRTNLRSN